MPSPSPALLAALALALLAPGLPASGPGTDDTLAWFDRASEVPRGLARLREARIRSRIGEEREEMVERLRALVDQNSGSGNPAGIEAVLGMVRPDLEEMGFECRLVPPDELGGPHLIARTEGEGPRVLMVGHVDTIFEADHPFQRMVVEGDEAHGPGVRDMKGGVVVMIHALRSLHRAGMLQGKPVTVLLNGDEETGSLSSRPLIEEAAREAAVGLVYEGSYRGRLTTTRGGLGQARFEIEGSPTHIASRPYAVDANQELAEKMVRILALNDPGAGTHVNVAPISGGIKRNQVSGRATGQLDLRYRTPEAGRALEERVREILDTSYVENPRTGGATTTRYQLLLHRPPFPETPEIEALASLVVGIGREVGLSLATGGSAGGSDQNLIAAQGTACLDSLGIDGTGAHTVDERADLGSLVPATRVSALLLGRLWRSWSPP